jgi:hypothetical protein
MNRMYGAITSIPIRLHNKHKENLSENPGTDIPIRVLISSVMKLVDSQCFYEISDR